MPKLTLYERRPLHGTFGHHIKIGSDQTRVVTALPGSLSLGRALRPLMRRVPSHTELVIDEEQSVQFIAHQLLAGQRLLLPALQLVQQRWLDVALVIDESSSMSIWRPTVHAFKRLLERHGAFRDVRTWGLVVDAKKNVRIRPGWASMSNARLRHPAELIDPRGRRLILVASDCVSSVWYSDTMFKTLANWGRKGAVAIVQVLPQRLWSRTALGDAIEVLLYARSPGLPNRQFDYEPSSYLIEKAELNGRFPIPVVAIKHEAFQQWVQAVVIADNAWAPGYMLDGPIEPLAVEDMENLTAKQRIRGFSTTASPLARTLLGLLASAPISLPVIRLIQHQMLPQSDLGHVAEVLLSGLLEQSQTNGEEYEFVEGVRDLLLETTEFVIDDTGRPFATVAAKVLRKLGGEYKTVAEHLEEMMSTSPPEEDVRKEDATLAQHLEQPSISEKQLDSLHITRTAVKVSTANILITLLGETPMVVTAMYDLLTGQEQLAIDKVVVLYPKEQALIDLGYDLIKQALVGKCEVVSEALPCEDISNEEDSFAFLRHLYALLNACQNSDDTVYFSLAGGRKNMSAFMALLVPLFPCVKKLYHVIDKDEASGKHNFKSIADLFELSEDDRLLYIFPERERLKLVDIPYGERQQVSAEFRARLYSITPEELEDLWERDSAQAAMIETYQRSMHQSPLPTLKIRLTQSVADYYRRMLKHDAPRANRFAVCFAQMSRPDLLKQRVHGTFPGDSRSFHFYKKSRSLERPFYHTEPKPIVVFPKEKVETVVISGLAFVQPDGSFNSR